MRDLKDQKDQRNKRYNVHIYAVVRVKVVGVYGRDHHDAICNAETVLRGSSGNDIPDVLNQELPTEDSWLFPQIAEMKDVEETVGYIVDDHVGDPEFANSVGYDIGFDGKPVQEGEIPASKWMLSWFPFMGNRKVERK